MENEKEVKEVNVSENQDQEPEKAVTTTGTSKPSFKEKLAMRKQAKKDDKARVLELKADLMRNPENPEKRKEELKTIRKRQLKRAAVPAAVVVGTLGAVVVTVAKAAGSNDGDQEATTTSSESNSEE